MDAIKNKKMRAFYKKPKRGVWTKKDGEHERSKIGGRKEMAMLLIEAHHTQIKRNLISVVTTPGETKQDTKTTKKKKRGKR